MGTHIYTRSLRIAAVIAAFAALALATGCGGDDSTSTGESTATAELPTGELTKAELATEADSLCSATTERILAAADSPEFGEDGPQPEEVEASAPFWSATVEEQQVLVDQLNQLQPEAKQQKQWDEFLVLFESGTVDFANDLLDAAENADPDTFYSTALAKQKDLTAAGGALERSRDAGLRPARLSLIKPRRSRLG